jgi:uncharacterized membrane protein YdbT with pleckstrin-like domain
MAHYLESLLSEQEKILHISRQHWFVLASSIFFEIAAILVILTVAVIVALIPVPVAPLVIVVVGFILILIPIATMTRDILIWTNRQYLITNRRVIQISGIINKDVTDSSLEKVNDIHLVQSVFGRIFNYGDLEILTASELGANSFRRIDHPVNFKTDLLDAKENLEHGDLAPVEPRQDIPALIAKLKELREQGTLTEEEYLKKKAELLAKI